MDESERVGNLGTSFILEVDLEYPRSLHDLLSDYPLASEQIEVNKINK